MKQVQTQIYRVIDGLYEEAVRLQMMWMKRVAERECLRSTRTDINDETTAYELRVEFNGAAFNVRWLHIQFVRRGTQTVRLSKSIAVPESGRYKITKFKHASEWELDLINSVESSLADIRYQMKHMMKSHQALIWASKIYPSNEIKSVAIKTRVEPSPYSIKKFKAQLA